MCVYFIIATAIFLKKMYIYIVRYILLLLSTVSLFFDFWFHLAPREIATMEGSSAPVQAGI